MIPLSIPEHFYFYILPRDSEQGNQTDIVIPSVYPALFLSPARNERS